MHKHEKFYLLYAREWCITSEDILTNIGDIDPKYIKFFKEEENGYKDGERLILADGTVLIYWLEGKLPSSWNLLFTYSYYYFINLKYIIYQAFLNPCFYYFLANMYSSGTSSKWSIVKPRSFRIPFYKLYTTPWMASLRSFWSHAFWTAGILEILITCCLIFNSTNVLYFWFWLPISDSLNLLLISRICDSHDSRGPKSFCWKAALTPPQP